MKLKLHLLLLYPSTWYICDFFLFHKEFEGTLEWIIGGGGVQRVLAAGCQLSYYKFYGFLLQLRYSIRYGCMHFETAV